MRKKKAYIFVATWGASSYTYAEAHPSQALTSWIGGHIRAFEYFGGVPELLAPDYVPFPIMWPELGSMGETFKISKGLAT
ncbi:MAG TPA: transposase [Thermoplasmata archaeon]|nr:transposase [Thermoplasmata archaeon]